MATTTNGFSRRTVLGLAGGSLAAAGLTDLGSASALVEVDVGVASERGRRAALAAADETVREFDAIDALTLRLSERAAVALENHPDVRYVERNERTGALV